MNPSFVSQMFCKEKSYPNRAMMFYYMPSLLDSPVITTPYKKKQRLICQINLTHATFKIGFFLWTRFLRPFMYMSRKYNHLVWMKSHSSTSFVKWLQDGAQKFSNRHITSTSLIFQNKISFSMILLLQSHLNNTPNQ